MTPPSRPQDDEDFLEELPPIDGGLGEEDPPDDGADDAGLDEGIDADGGLDDATLGGDPGSGLVVEGREGGWLEDSAEADELEVGGGGFEFAEGEKLLEDGDERGEANDEYDLVGGDSQPGLDRGEEGPEGEGDDLSESELPQIDADHEGDAEDALVAEPMVELGDEVQHPWDDRAWQRAAVPLRIAPMCAIAHAGDGAVMAGGRVLATVASGGRSAVLAAEGLTGALVTALSVGPGGLVAVITEAGVMVSVDGGATFTPRGGWRAIVPSGDARRMAAIALSGEALAAITPAGRLLVARASAAVDAAWTEALPGRRAVGLVTADGGGAAALVSGAGGALALARIDPDGAAHMTALPALMPPLRLDVAAPLAVRGTAVAFAVDGVAVFRSVGGTPWERVPGTGDATAIAFLDDEGTLVAALGDARADEAPGDVGPRGFVVRAPRGDAARIVAEVGEDEPAGAPVDIAPRDDRGPAIAALAWDDRARVMWVAGAFGLAAFRPA